METSRPNVRAYRCRVCDRPPAQPLPENTPAWNDVIPLDEYAEAVFVLHALVEDSGFRRSKGPRILAAHAMRRMINHLSDGDFLALGSSSFGPWLMRSLQSSVRELRVAAAYVYHSVQLAALTIAKASPHVVLDRRCP